MNEFQHQDDRGRIDTLLQQQGISEGHRLYQYLVLILLDAAEGKRRSQGNAALEVSDADLQFNTAQFELAQTMAADPSLAKSDPMRGYEGTAAAGPRAVTTKVAQDHLADLTTIFGDTMIPGEGQSNSYTALDASGAKTVYGYDPETNTWEFVRTIEPPLLPTTPPVGTGVSDFLPEAFLGGAPAYGRALSNLGIGGLQGGVGNYLQALRNPALTSFLGMTAATDPAAPEYAQYFGDAAAGLQLDNPFQTFVERNLGQRMNQVAGAAFQNLLGRGGNANLAPGLAGSFINPTNIQEFQGAANLGLGALRGRIGSLAAGILAPDANALYNQFAQSAAAQEQNAFLPFLNQRLGLGF